MNICEKIKIPLLTIVTTDAKEMKALHAVLICLIIFAIFGYTATMVGPVFQQDNNLTLEGKNALHESPIVLQPEKPVPIYSADPIDDPTPH